MRLFTKTAAAAAAECLLPEHDRPTLVIGIACLLRRVLKTDSVWGEGVRPTATTYASTSNQTSSCRCMMQIWLAVSGGSIDRSLTHDARSNMTTDRMDVTILPVPPEL
jgi:hypothetical protein